MKSLHLAAPDDLTRLLPLVAAFHTEMGIERDDTVREAALAPLLAGSPHGAVWLIGPRKAPVGYIALSFGWSLEFGGLDAMVDELYIRPAVRQRGMGSEALNALAKGLKESGVRALHLEVSHDDDATRRFYRRARFHERDGFMLMSRAL